MPLFNKRKYVADSLASVARQSFTDYEIIVVDDGSTDDGAQIVREMNLPNLRLIRQENAGVSVARNRCLAESSSEFVAFLDADDVWRQDHLKHLWSLHVAFPDASLLANSFQEVSAIPDDDVATAVQYRGIEDFIAEAAAGCAWVFTSAAMIHRDRCLSLGGFEADENRGEDIDLWIRMGSRFPVALSDYVGSFYRRVDNSLTTSLSVLQPDIAMRRIAATLGTETGMGPARRRAFKELYNRIAIANATDCLAKGQREAARMFLSLSSDTEVSRSRWRILQFLCLMPPSAVTKLARMRNRVRAVMESGW